MTLILKYFGMVAEASGKEQEELFNHYSSIQELRTDLLVKYPDLGKINFKIAVNHTIIEDNCDVIGNDEIALLPPFAGG